MMKILIVEDDPLIARMYQKIFTLENYEVILASDGQEGIDKATTLLPNLILLDVMMPKMNGLQVLELLKRDLKTRAIPVIMLSNLTGEQDEEATLKMGAAKFLIKSEHEPDEIVKVVKELLGTSTPVT